MSNDNKTEIEVAGIKFRGGKIGVIVLALSTLSGGLYGAFEFYKDYSNMKDKIETYIAPDLSGFQEKMAVIEERIIAINQEVELAVEYTRDIKTDIKGDITWLEGQVQSSGTRTKTSEAAIEELIEKSEDRLRLQQTTINAVLDGIRSEMGKLMRETAAKDADVRDNTNKLINEVYTQMRETRTNVRADLDILEKDLNNQIEEALDNPLNDVTK